MDKKNSEFKTVEKSIGNQYENSLIINKSNLGRVIKVYVLKGHVIKKSI